MAVSRQPCSIVLEGGVTSAVIYASLLARLSEDYSFKQLGGASSGAVAAAAAAGAEYARLHDPDRETTAFQVLKAFPNQLAETDRSGHTMLYRLFQPKAEGLPAFNVAMAALDASGSDSQGRKVARVLLALVREFWDFALLLAILVGGMGWITADWLYARLSVFPSIDQLLGGAALWLTMMGLGIAGAALALLAWALWRTLCALRSNHWGLCNGMTQPGCDTRALTETLYGLFQQLAGLPKGPLLTFGHLWWGPKVDERWDETGERQIDLQIVTTSVNLARPVRLPGDPGDEPLHEFFYDPDEWKELFPEGVMLHLKAFARPATLTHDDGRQLVPLPEPKHLPVLVAVRFSLSFPILLSALPMYIAVPRRAMLRAGEAAARPHFEARKVYFSDGGITSNCPIHLFDAPLPRFPTFGVDLYGLPPGQQRDPVRSDERDPELDAAQTPDAAKWTSPVPFLVGVVSTMLNWRDNLQRGLPGFRERMVHIGLPPEVGGLHLAMKPATILHLAKQGVAAAERLQKDFATAPQSESSGANAWERHRWTRARISLTALRHYLAAFAGRLGAGDPAYDRLIRTANPQVHPFGNDAARHQALELMNGAGELMQTMDANQPSSAMDENSPQPQPELHLSPPW